MVEVRSTAGAAALRTGACCTGWQAVAIRRKVRIVRCTFA
jgi:hypothetical protein